MIRLGPTRSSNGIVDSGSSSVRISKVCQGARAKTKSDSLPSREKIDHPTTSNVFPRFPAMFEHTGILVVCCFQSVRKHSQLVVRSFLIDGLSDGNHHVGPFGYDFGNLEGISEDVAHQFGLRLMLKDSCTVETCGSGHPLDGTSGMKRQRIRDENGRPLRS